MKITQYCSVCREELAMEVVPTDDGEDDGVIWLRCPRCQGFLPKIENGFADGDQKAPAATADTSGMAGAVTDPQPAVPVVATTDPSTPAVVSSVEESTTTEIESTTTAPAETGKPETSSESTEEEIPAAYAAKLAAMDVSRAVPYRPWDRYEEGDVIHHLAWDDCGVVVAKESLPGNRRIVKVYFERAGIVRLIEQADAES